MRSQRLHKVALLMLLLFASQIASAETKYYRLTRKYNSKNQVIETYKNSGIYIVPAFLSAQAMLGTRGTCMLTFVFDYGNGELRDGGCLTYYYNSSNNGWDIYVQTIGYTTNYVYVKKDRSCIRETMTAGGGGNYKEYLPCSSPLTYPDHLGPTR